MFSVGRGNNGQFKQFKFNQKCSVDAQFPFSIFLFLCSKFFYHLASPLRSAKMIMFNHQVIPGILEPQLSLWNPRMSLGGECVCGVDPKGRGGHHSLPKAMVCHHQGKTIGWDLALVLMYIFLTNSLTEKISERLRATWNRAFAVRMKRKQSICIKKRFGSHFVS